MGRVLLITEARLKVGVDMVVNDVVEIRPTYSIDTETEKTDFNIVEVDDELIKAAMYGIEFKSVYRTDGTSTWSAVKPRVEEKRIWRKKGDLNYFELKRVPRFLYKFDKGIIKENLSTYPENIETAVDSNGIAIK